MSRNKGSELKSLLTQRSALLAELDEIRQQQNTLHRSAGKIERRLAAIRKQQSALERSGPIVTEHAILRYLERGIGMDMGELRDHILTADVRAAVKAQVSGPVAIDHNCKAIVKGHTVVSVTGGNFHGNYQK
jgi:DNA repair exonuclease SbcCD ATPase subunit